MPRGTLMTLLCFPHSPSDDFSPAWWCDRVCIVNKPAPRLVSGATASRTPSNRKHACVLFCMFVCFIPHRKSKFMLGRKQKICSHCRIPRQWRFPAVSYQRYQRVRLWLFTQLKKEHFGGSAEQSIFYVIVDQTTRLSERQSNNTNRTVTQ